MAAPFPALTKTYRHGPYPAIDPTLSELSVTGKVAIITGGGGTIGAAIANSLAQAGIKHVALLGRRMESLNTTKAKLDIDFPKTKVSVYSTDITSRVAVKDAFEKFHAEVGQQVDVLISNAGYLSELSSIADADAEDWVTCINTNIVGSFFVAKEFMSICSSAATVVNITSAAAHVQIPKLSAYSCAKVAVVKLFEFLHSENPGLRVFNLHPGMVDSEMNTKGGLPPLDDCKCGSPRILTPLTDPLQRTCRRVLQYGYAVRRPIF